MSVQSSSLDATVVERVAANLKLDPNAVRGALGLLAEGLAIPYIARYQREAVGGADERTLAAVRAQAAAVRDLEQRREFIVRALADREDVPPKIRKRVESCRSRTELEYLYEPFRPPRKTPGSVAAERGLAPLADAYLKGELPDAGAFLDAAKGVADEEQARRGAREILAERFAADPEVRGALLRVLEKEGVVTTSPPPGKDAIPDRFRAFRKYGEKLGRIPSHRFLALRRAEREGALALHVELPEEKVRKVAEDRFFPAERPDEVSAFLEEAVTEAIKKARPAVLEDALRAAKERADGDAIGVVRNNLHDLLFFPPLGPARVLGVDPAPRGTIPVACVDERGAHLESARLKFFGKDEAKIAASKETLRRLVATHGITSVALGNGTGRNECEDVILDAVEPLGDDAPQIVLVNEVGVGSYASGPVGRAELPALPVPVRAAVSLARRLIDPLSELVKVDPRHLGVGQYLNDVDSAPLSRALSEAAASCVNAVGADVNRASPQQLGYVCGLTPSIARSLVEHREKNGPFRTLGDLRALPFVSEGAFEQAAGFLRVEGGEDPLDATGVHPGHRPLVDRIAERVGASASELVGNHDKLADVVAEEYADEAYSPAVVEGVLFELLSGGRDPRPVLEVPRRTPGVRKTADLKEGMRLPGRVTNVTNFGAFVDVGVRQDGLVHVSELADHFVKDPTTVAHVGQVVEVRVLGVDADTGRISLSMKSERPARGGGRGGGGGGGRGRPRGDGGRGGGGRRPRRDRDRERDDRTRDEAPMSIASQAPASVAPTDLPENPIPTDMSEEEFMQRKLDEIRKRFG